MDATIREMRVFDVFKLRNLKTEKDYGVLFTGQKFSLASRIYNKVNLFFSLISRRIALKKFIVFVLMADGKVEGITYLTLERKNARFAIFINKNYRGRGYGRALMETVFDWAKKHKMDVKLTVKESNKRAKSLYEKMGFSVYDSSYQMIKPYDKK